MSAITTWGWGEQGGLVTTLGWGGAPGGPDINRVRSRPRLARSFELRPQVAANRSDPEPRTLAKELRPQVAAWDDALRPRPTSGLELVPQLTGSGQPEAIRQPTAKELRPAMTSGKRTDQVPRAEGAELRPQVVSGSTTAEEPKQPVVSHVLKPKITGSEGD